MLQALMRWITEVIRNLSSHRKQKIPAHQPVRQTQRKKAIMNDTMDENVAITRILKPSCTVRLNSDSATLSPELKKSQKSKTADPLTLSWEGMSDIGLVRSQNEDNFSCLALRNETLFVVADGMGGHEAGEIASKIAVDMVCKHVQERVKKNGDPASLLKHAVLMANEAVRQEGQSRQLSMGTTLSVVLIIKNMAYIANVGDSRVYSITNGSITQITEDHSLVGKLVAAGKLTREEARKHPQSNLLYRTVGTDDNIKVDTFQVELTRGSMLLLCTDGLWGEVIEEKLYQIIVAENDIGNACKKLVKMANDNGGSDNITVLIAKVT